MIVNLDYLPRAGGVMTGDVAFPTGKSILVGGTGDMNDGVRVAGIAIGSGYYALNIAHAEYDSPVLLRGVGDPEQDTDAVNKGYVYETVPHLGAVRPSILDNGLFCGSGLPVNQRGDTSWTTSGYHIDRWKHIQNTDDFPGSSVSGSIQSDGLHIGSGGIFEQPIEPDVLDCLAGKQITVSALVKAIGFGTFTTTVNTSGSYGSVVGSGGCSISIDYTNNNFKISNEMSSEIIVKGVKIEEGDTQTLAYQDEDGAWQLLPQPESDYLTQLLKCRQYLQPVPSELSGIVGIPSSFNLGCVMPMSIPLKSPRNASLVGIADECTLHTDAVSNCSISTMVLNRISESSAIIIIKLSDTNGLSAGEAFYVDLSPGTFISAEL